MTDQANVSSEMPFAIARSSLDFAGYQDGSVVSRVLLKRGGGTVTFFAFDAGQGLSEHTAPFDAIAHMLEGEAEMIISGATVHVTQGEMVLMPANQPHALSVPSVKKVK